jgi:hypothetical protein
VQFSVVDACESAAHIRALCAGSVVYADRPDSSVTFLADKFPVVTWFAEFPGAAIWRYPANLAAVGHIMLVAYY